MLRCLHLGERCSRKIINGMETHLVMKIENIRCVKYVFNKIIIKYEYNQNFVASMVGKSKIILFSVCGNSPLIGPHKAWLVLPCQILDIVRSPSHTHGDTPTRLQGEDNALE